MPTVTVDRLQWEMAQWEIHALRSLVTVLIIRAQLFAKNHPSDEARLLGEEAIMLKERLREQEIEALMNSDKRLMRDNDDIS